MRPANVITAGVLSETDRIKAQLCQSIRSPGLNPQNIFILLAALLEQEYDGSDRETAVEFLKFIKAPPPGGLGLEPEQLKKIIVDLKHPHEIPPHRDKAIKKRMDWMRERITELIGRASPLHERGELGQGRPNRDSIRIPIRGGTNTTYTLARLERDRPELAKRVRKGELSANAAAIEAGFRNKSFTIVLDPGSAAKAIRKHFSPEQIDELVAYLTASVSR